MQLIVNKCAFSLTLSAHIKTQFTYFKLLSEINEYNSLKLYFVDSSMEKGQR